MLTSTETKAVLTTLTQRRAWLRKTLEENKLDADARKENTFTLQQLESAMKKIAALKPAAVPKSSLPPSSTAPKQRKRPITPADTRVLIADDQASITEMIEQILIKFGIGVIEKAQDGREAFDKLKRASPPFDIILCDWEMPELTGLQVLDKAKASNTLGDTFFWMVTASTDPKKIKEAASKGIHDYIAKPIEQSTLEEKLKAAIVAKGGSVEAS